MDHKKTGVLQKQPLANRTGKSMSHNTWHDDPDTEEDLNVADYVDALLRPKSQRLVLFQEKIKGRRLRDQYLDEVTVSKVIER